jgi:hypothetical protein
MTQHEREQAITPGRVWMAADGRNYGVRIVSAVKPNGDVTVADLATGAERDIDSFKLTYRYYPLPAPSQEPTRFRDIDGEPSPYDASRRPKVKP